MERARTPDDPVARAALGDVKAAEEILRQIASESPESQLPRLRELTRTGDYLFWRRLLEFLATGQWAGLPLESDLLRAELYAPIHSLFLVGLAGEGARIARREALVAGLTHEHPVIRAQAVELVAADAGLVNAIIDALHDEDRNVRFQAARGLGNLRDPRAVQALVQTVLGSDEILAGIAKDALVAIGKPALEPLVEMLQDSTAPDRTRWLAARALEQIADETAVPALVANLGDADYGIRWAVAHALASLKLIGLRATLRFLACEPLNAWRADAGAMVLHHGYSPQVDAILKPVLKSLEGVDFEWQTPGAAERALNELEGLPG